MRRPVEDVPEQWQAPGMDLLARRVPLALLVDLATGSGTDSRGLLDAEGAPELPWWEPPA